MMASKRSIAPFSRVFVALLASSTLLAASPLMGCGAAAAQQVVKCGTCLAGCVGSCFSPAKVKAFHATSAETGVPIDVLLDEAISEILKRRPGTKIEGPTPEE